MSRPDDRPLALAGLVGFEQPDFSWAKAGAARKVADALERRTPESARFVGGCVRDALLGLKPADIDVATTLTPPSVIEALSAAGLRSAPTGLDHGTVTAICDGVGVEVTTLRADVSTDGRRATVRFTDDWVRDAERRDFTINALYLSTDMHLYDYVGGLADLKAPRVRFIGDAHTRIQEDYLRILRFFRFSARFGESDFDADGLEACAVHAAGIKRLSRERIGDEFLKILSLPSPGAALRAMQASAVLQAVWATPPDIELLEAVKNLDKDASAATGLAALWGLEGAGLESALRLSNAMSARRRRAASGAASLQPHADARALRMARYKLGADAFADASLIIRAREKCEEVSHTFCAVEASPLPVFALTGGEIVKNGVAPGPLVSKTLAAIEARWIAEGFPDEQRLIDIMREEIAAIS